MCGITGYWNRDGRPAEPRRLEAMLNSMIHRGPDGSGQHVDGSLAFGMRRLAILDLERGQQPFFSNGGRVASVMNGEIYNFRELRRELAGRGTWFRTQCDAEILPHAYEHFGIEGMLERLDGMYAIAIHDRARGRLHLARDRFGEKPLFYADRPRRFAFASHLATLQLMPEVRDAIDLGALRQFLAMHFVAGPRTILEDVRRVPPGHRLELDLSGNAAPALRRWWQPADGIARAPRRGGRGAVARVRAALERAVESRLVSDVPLGLFLSGGIDSSAVAAVMAAQGACLRTFSIGFEDAELDESKHARQVASFVGAEHHHFAFDLHACLDTMDEAIASAGEPVGDPAALPLFLLSREARRHVKVVLSGEGADEVFAGYGYYPPTTAQAGDSAFRWLRRLSRRFAAPPPRRQGASSFYRLDYTTPSGFPLLTTPEQRDELVLGDSADEDEWLLAIADRCGQRPCALQAAQLADVETWLPDDLLPKLDRMTMAASIEGRAPYLEPAIAALGLALPAARKVAPEGVKLVLRSAVESLLPADILTRPKQGFVLPMQQWLTGPLRERLLDELSGDRSDGLDWKRARALAERDVAAGATRSRLLYALLAYRIWVDATRGGPLDRPVAEASS